MFQVNSRNGSGFWIEFANGRGVSVQWGPETYSSNQHNEGSFLTASSAEVMVLPSGEPMGFRTPEEVAEVIYRVSNMGVLNERNRKGAAEG